MGQQFTQNPLGRGSIIDQNSMSNHSFTSQAIYRRIEEQGFNRTHTIPKEYKKGKPFFSLVNWMFNSPTSVVGIADDSWKYSFSLFFTTLSGVCLISRRFGFSYMLIRKFSRRDRYTLWQGESIHNLVFLCNERKSTI